MLAKACSKQKSSGLAVLNFPQVAWRKLVKQVIINIQSKCRIFFFQLSGSTLEAQMCTWGTYSLLVDVAVMGTVSMEISFMTPDHLL